MKKIIWITSALLAFMAVSSCNRIVENNDFVPEEINFTAGIGNYQTKLTDSAFDDGDQVGLFADAPLNFANVKLTWNGSGFTPDQKLYWAENQQGKAKFRAYHPFNAGLTALEDSIAFYVNDNQNEYKKYVASDFMLAETAAGPEDKSVYLGFDHMFSKVSVVVENKSGVAIKDALFAGLRPGVKIDCATGGLGQVLGEEETFISAATLQDKSGNPVYSVIVPPQTAYFGLVLMLESGRTVLLSSKAELLSGKQYTGKVTISEITMGDPVSFTLSMSEWEEGESYRFASGVGTSQHPGWRVIYFTYVESENGFERTISEMEETNPGEFFFNIPEYKQNDYFFLLSTYDNYIFGCTLTPQQTVWNNDGCWPVDNGGQFQLSGYEGNLNIWFYPNEGYLRYEPVYQY